MRLANSNGGNGFPSAMAGTRILGFLAGVPLLWGAPAELPLLSIDDLEYRGAFRLPADDFGGSSMNFAEGPIAYNPFNHSVFLVGHAHHQAVAEFAVPGIVNSADLADLDMASVPLQEFTPVLDRPATGNPQGMDRIGGMAVFPGEAGAELMINTYQYYDASGSTTHTTLVVRDASGTAASRVDGYFTFSGGQAHTSGWISPVPAAWRETLGGAYLTGHSSGIPIISRASVGPSAFAFDPEHVIGAEAVPDPIPTTRLLDFSLDNPLHQDLSNETGSNDLWNHLTRATFGMIVPGTRTYLTLGFTGGIASGVCYKCTQTSGRLCGGYCAPDAADYSQYYWLWDVNDLARVKNGQLEPHAVRPYDYGKFSTPFQGESPRPIGGGSYDPGSGILYLTVEGADRAQGAYSNPPVVVVYGFRTFSGAAVSPPEARRPIFEYTIIPPRLLLQLDRAAAIRVDLLALDGRRKISLMDAGLPAGRHVFSLPGGMAPGPALVRIRRDDRPSGYFLWADPARAR